MRIRRLILTLAEEAGGGWIMRHWSAPGQADHRDLVFAQVAVQIREELVLRSRRQLLAVSLPRQRIRHYGAARSNSCIVSSTLLQRRVAVPQLGNH
jgi:hypothetical protein